MINWIMRMSQTSGTDMLGELGQEVEQTCRQSNDIVCTGGLHGRLQ